jgi:UDP-glucose 4-epimerase
MMKVLVTGGAGFVGSYVVRELVAGGSDISVILRNPDAAWRLSGVLADLRVVRADLADREAVARALGELRPDAVVHLAWDGVLGSARNDLAQVRNVGLSLMVAEEAARAGAGAWIGLGSQAEYGPCPDRVDETAPTRPTTLYGAAKLAVCIAAERVAALAGMRFAWLRLFSSYGPKDNPAWMIPYLMLSLLRSERPRLTGGEQLWDYVYVEDVARAIAAVTLSSDASNVFNLGSGQVASIRSIAEQIRDRIDPKLPLDFGAIPYRPDQVMHLEADVRRLRRATGWRPQTTLDTGLARTLEWYREHPSAD